MSAVFKLGKIRWARWAVAPAAALLSLAGLAAPAGAGVRPDASVLSNVVTVASDNQSGSFCALLSTGHVNCWGYNADGELGNGSTTSSDVPVPVVGVTNATSIAENSDNGSGTFCAVLATHHVKCWGYGNDGELGNGTTTTFTVPVAVKNITNATAVFGGDSSFCALLATSHIDCWGYNGDGELGNGNFNNSDVPVAVHKITNASTIVASYDGYCALLATSQVNCWGYNGDGELGNGNFNNSDVPVTVLNISTAKLLTSDVGAGSTCAVLSTGHVQCWGYNADGELGNGTTASSDKPVTAVGIGTAKAISEAGDGNAGSLCARLANSHLDCWGYNNDGELGNGNTTNFTVPVAVKNITTATTVTGGYYGVCALLATSHIDCWGSGGNGELGNGTFNNSDVPVAVRKITNATLVVRGYYDYCALLSTGHVDCWGYNSDGELGNGNMNDSDVPVSVLAPR